ncbi:MAG TPA: glycine cleavage system protein GcvH [Phycisphaerae bacterium]|nr:glycine cleavage system protein GcvH [Phycisphaerae bacterium]
MAVPNDRRYLKSHEWHKLDGDICTIGITQFAADELTDVTYVSLPAVGKQVTTGKSFGEIESVKATSDLNSGVTGVVTEVNKGLNDAPETVNNDPMGAGWMIKVKVAAADSLKDLLTADQYHAQLSGK